MENPNYKHYTGKYRHNTYKYLSNIVDPVSSFVLNTISQKKGNERVKDTYQEIQESILQAQNDNQKYITKTICSHIASITEEDKQLNPFHKELLARLRRDGYHVVIVPDPKSRVFPLSHSVIIKISR